jgi:hypothetical protein
VLVPDLQLLKLFFVGAFVDFFKNIFEAAIVLLEDGVFGAQVQGIFASDSILERRVGEFVDGIVGVVHAEHDTGALKLVHFHLGGGRAVTGGEGHVESAGDFGAEVCGAILVTKGVSADDDGLSPSGNAARDVLDDDGFAENDTTTDVADGSIGRLPHLLEVELLNTCLIWGDGCTFNSDFASLDGVCAVNSDLIVSRITVLDAQVVVLNVKVQVGRNELVLDDVPDDTGHLIAVHFDDWVFDFDSSFHPKYL